MTALENKKHIQILVVDDEPGMCDLLQMELTSQGYNVATMLNPVEALGLIEKQKFDLVISDMKMPQMDGIALLENIKRLDPAIEVIMTTGYGTIESAVIAMKHGAYDFVLKPFNVEELMVLVERALEKRGLKTLLALYESSQAIFSTIKLRDLLEIIMDMVRKVHGADEGSLMLVGEDHKLYIAVSRGIPEEWVSQTHLEVGERVSGFAAKEKKAMLLINGLEKYPEFKGIPSNSRIRSSIICPLLCQNELLGVLNISRTKNTANFTPSDLQSVSIFASQAALAIQNAKLYENLRDAYQKLEKAQDQLLQSEKLASIGRLVAGVAHELNNPLTSVIGYSQLAAESESLSDIKQQQAIIYEQAQRCSRIVKDLLVFSRTQRPDFRVVDLVKIMEESLGGVSLELQKRKIQLKRNDAGRPVSILVDSGQMKQVFTNILTNAYQALEEVPRERWIETDIRTLAGVVQIRIQDNGPGISKEHLKKIFDPFFTTKEVGKGTGLGLSLVYGIVKEHGGKISVQSEPGSGTSFLIELPLNLLLKDQTPSSREAASPAKLQLKKILIVEDEPQIRSLIKTFLGNLISEFDTAEDGSSALEKFRKTDYDLILCDYRIPKLNGAEFFEQARRIKPDISKRFIFVTGSTEFIRGSESFFGTNRLACLSKPFTRQMLLDAIERQVNPDASGRTS